MDKVTFVVRDKDSKAKVKVRFRLRDGRRLQLFHSTTISTTVGNLLKFEPNGDLAKGIKVYDKDLRQQIQTEYNLMTEAFDQMKEEGMDLTSEILEELIEKKRNPIQEERAEVDTLDDRFRRYIEDASRDGIIGDLRKKHLIVVADKLARFLHIKGQTQMTPQEFNERWLMDFRSFVFDEYTYVKKYAKLYSRIKEQNRPQDRLSINTVSSQMKILQTFFNELESYDEIVKSPFRKLNKERAKAVTKTKYDDPVFLRRDEFETVRNAKVPSFLEPVRDAFVVQCAFGCRIGDFQKMSMDNVSVSEDGIPYIHYLPHKTADEQKSNTEIITPITRFAFDIIKRTGFSFPIVKNIYGTLGYNVQIRSLLKHCKIERKVPVYNEKTKENEYLPVCDLGSSKLCRKTHVDMMNKVQINIYAAALHKAGSNAVNRYTAMELKDRFTLMNLAFGQKEYKVDSELNIVGKK